VRRNSVNSASGLKTALTTLRGTVNEYQPYEVAYGLTERSSLQLGLRVGGHLALTDFHSEDPYRRVLLLLLLLTYFLFTL